MNAVDPTPKIISKHQDVINEARGNIGKTRLRDSPEIAVRAFPSLGLVLYDGERYCPPPAGLAIRDW